MVPLNDGTAFDKIEVGYIVGHKGHSVPPPPPSAGQVQETHRVPLQGRPPEEVSFMIGCLDGQPGSSSCFCTILNTVNDAASLAKLPVDTFTDLFVKA